MKDKDCIFCKIANGEIPSSTVYEDSDFRVILDLNPASPGHALILPKEHYRDLTELPAELCGKAFCLAGKIGRGMMKGLCCSGFNVVQNNGISAGQTVFHFHIHIIPRYDNAPLIVTWKPGTSTPESLAETAGKIKAAL
jgi:histidine triad (HIT) family protein